MAGLSVRLKVLIYALAELYGCERIKDDLGNWVPAYSSNKGMRLSAREVARQIVEIEEELLEDGWIQSKVTPGPADGQIFNVNETESDSIAQLMASEGVEWERADKSAGTRKNGLEMIRVALENTLQGEGAGLYVMDNCHAFLETVPNIPRDEDNPDDVDTTSIDHCFVAGTMIQTATGEKPIEALNVGDMVLTRFGESPVLGIHKTRNAEVINNQGLTGTPNHKVWTYEGIKELQDLTKGDTLYSWRKHKSHIKASYFGRYPDSPRREDRVYFKSNGTHRKAGVESLHREIYKDVYGSIPRGHVVHHKDGNPLNNSPENLEAITQKEHVQIHLPENIDRLRKQVEEIRPLASKWHGSDAGREYHSRLAKENWEKIPKRTYVCKQCGCEWQSQPMGPHKFCSNKCKSAWRRESGVDDVGQRMRSVREVF